MAGPGDHPAKGLEWSAGSFYTPRLSMHIIVLICMPQLLVADYVDLICMFVGGSDCSEFIQQEIINHKVSDTLLLHVGG